MQVVSIEVEGINANAQDGVLTGHVAFRHLAEAGRDWVHFDCAVPLPEGASDAALSDALIAEASRQMLRMPGYRTGRKQLEFLTDAGLIQAA
ncbi:hypothetical protein Ga0609869_001024 [Rhodovulum iodosum]|uniref:Uncharacterized protein n=1 Tax=Rhodovulum iodosum TaxID=68291 RepID=A0ABV3XQR3_9RHOB|nr:hypothetical protein [Rhodovulum robiginosum]RSK32903.1 hypothetical protein EJA01_11285 [Rhodovulum robiginosum]